MKKPFVLFCAKNKKTAFAAVISLVLLALVILFSPGESLPAFASGGAAPPQRGLFDLVRGMVS